MGLPASRKPSDLPGFVLPSKPWYRTLGENVHALMAPEVSQPTSVREIWSRNEGMRRAQALSLVTHALAALLLALPVYRAVVNSPSPSFPLDPMKRVFFYRGGGSGGERNPAPATAGRVPRFEWIPRTPPAPIRNSNPKLAEEPTLQGPPEIPVPSVPLLTFGDPTASSPTDSAGPGGGSGFGPGCCGGVGPGSGPGLGPGRDGGTGGEGEPGMWKKAATPPECAYCPNPAFSDEARKAKLQGSVLLRLVVTRDGRADRIRVVKSLGFGLDEKALEAVRAWRFKPARDPSGKFVPTWVTVEMTFRLL